MELVVGSNTAASANACWVKTAIEQGGCSSKGVESPVADRTSFGSLTKQSMTEALSAMATNRIGSNRAEEMEKIANEGRYRLKV